MNLSEKAIKKVQEANQCLPRYCVVQGPRGLQGPTGPQGIPGPTGPDGASFSPIFSGMNSTIGYPLRITSTPQDYGIIFNNQSLTKGDFDFQAGGITLSPYEVTPGKLIIKNAGIYEIYFALSNLTTEVSGEFDFLMTLNDGGINNGVARITMRPNEEYTISRKVITQLNTNDVVGLAVRPFVSSNGLLHFSGGQVEMLVIKLSD